MPDRPPLHPHHHGGEPPALHRLAAAWLWRAVAVCGAVTVLAVLLLWPRADDRFDDPLLLDADTVSATVLTAGDVPCSYDAAWRRSSRHVSLGAPARPGPPRSDRRGGCATAMTCAHAADRGG